MTVAQCNEGANTHRVVRTMQSRRAAAMVGVSMCVAVLSSCQSDKGPKSVPKVPVLVATASVGTVPITIPANGIVEPIESVALQARVAGPVVAVHFSEGDEVRAGQILFQIDSDRYQSAVSQARAVLARDRASAAAAKSDAARYASLVSKGYVTQSQTEQQRAIAEALAATVTADEAAVHTAEIDLAYTTVRAPIAGRTGNLNVRVGNQVNGPSGMPLAVINAVAPIYVRVSVPERSLPAVRSAQTSKAGLQATVRGSATNDVIEHGEVTFIDNAVDSVSGTVWMKAKFPNADKRLWPGAFVPLTLTLGALTDVVLIPSVAVQQGPAGAYVFMPDATGKVRQVPIEVSRVVGDSTIVASGISKGDQVVIDGQSRLFAGAEITMAKKLTPPALADTPRSSSSSRGAPVK